MELKTSHTFAVRFSEVDSMRVVWHGSYPLYFEDAREAFGKEFALEYMRIADNGFLHHSWNSILSTYAHWYTVNNIGSTSCFVLQKRQKLFLITRFTTPKQVCYIPPHIAYKYSWTCSISCYGTSQIFMSNGRLGMLNETLFSRVSAC